MTGLNAAITQPLYQGFQGNLFAGLKNALVMIPVYFAVAKQRRQLAAMTNRALKDIGVSRADAVIEANRSFWDLPKSYR